MKTLSLVAGAAALTLSSIAFADGHSENPAVKARQSHMQLYTYNIGILGGMAQGKIDYDADAAQLAADNLATLAAMETRSYWPEGTAEGTKARPEIWENIDDFWDKEDGLLTEADRMAEVAGTGLEGLQSVMGDLGGTCSACHRLYRAR